MSPRTTFASIFAVSALALGSAALAQSGTTNAPMNGPMNGAGPMGGPGTPGGAHGRMAMQPEAVAQRLAQVKDALRLSPDQQGAWSGYEQSIKRAADGRAKMHESMQGTRGQPDAMDDAHVAMMKLNAQSAEEVNNARKALVATLSPEQKSTFDKMRPGAQRGGHGGHGSAAPAQRQPS